MAIAADEKSQKEKAAEQAKMASVLPPIETKFAAAPAQVLRRPAEDDPGGVFPARSMNSSSYWVLLPLLFYCPI